MDHPLCCHWLADRVGEEELELAFLASPVVVVAAVVRF